MSRAVNGIVACVLGVMPLVAAADPTPAEAVREAWQVSQSRLHELLSRTLTFVRPDRPRWLIERSYDDLDPGVATGDDTAQLVMQQDRPDGADLLTLRYPLIARGAVRTYAGAGLNQAYYFADDGVAPVMLTGRNRQRSLGAAAEVGAEVQVSREFMISADLRWADLDRDAVLLRSDDGYVGADPVTVGVSVGWRFR